MINDVSLLGMTHSEAVQTIKSMAPTSVVKVEMIQGDEVGDSQGLSPDWTKWMAKYEVERQRYVCLSVCVSVCVCGC